MNKLFKYFFKRKMYNQSVNNNYFYRWTNKYNEIFIYLLKTNVLF